MDIPNKTNEELKSELLELRQEIDSLKVQLEKRDEALKIANKELVFKTEEKAKRAAELSIVNIEIDFQNEAKEKRADELIVANIELAFQNGEKGKRADELDIANVELAFQNEEKRKRAAENELKFHNLFENSPIAKSITGIDGSLMVNKSFCDILGYSKKDFKTKKWQDLTFPDDIEKSNKIVQSLLQGMNKQAHFEKRYVHKNGNIIYADVSTFLQRDKDHNPEYFITAFTDVTDLKQAEKEREQFLNFFKLSPDIMVIADPNGAFKAVNPATTKLLGYSEEELFSKPFIDFVHADDKQPSLDEMARQIKIGSSLNFENRYRCKNGSYIRLSWCSYFNKEEGITYATARDVTKERMIETELKGAKEKAEKNEKELKKAQQIAHIGSWNLDIKTNEVVWSEELYKMYGFDPLLPVPLFTEHQKLFTTESWELLSTSLANTLATGTPYELELQTVKKDKEKGWMWVRGEAIIDKENKIIELRGAAQDITSRKLVEQALKDSDERWKTIFKDIPNVAVQGYDKNGITKYWNKASETLYGFSVEEAIGKNLIDLIIPEEMKSAVSDAIKSMFRTKIPIPAGELKLRRKDGSTVIVLSSHSFVEIPGHEPEMYCIDIDISGRKQAELESVKAKEKAERNEKEFRQLSESMPQIVWVTRADGWNIYFNQQWVDYTGLSLEESYGHGWNKPFHPDDQQRALDAWQNAVENNGIYSIESRLRQKDGNYQWWLVRGVPILDENNKIIKWFGTCTNIEELKKIESEIINANKKLLFQNEEKEKQAIELIAAKEKIEESEEKFKKAFISAPFPIIIHAEDGEVVSINEAFTSITGYSHKDIPTIPDWTEKAYGKRSASIKEYINKLYTLDKKVDEGEYEIFTANGEQIVWDFSSASLGKMNDGRILVISMANDVTVRKQAEKELLKLSRALEQSPVSIIITDLNGTIEYANPKVTAITGYQSSELLGKNPRIFSSGSKSKVDYSEIWQAISNGNDWYGEFLNKKKNGELFWEYASISPIVDVEGKITHYLGVKEDITEKKQALELLRQSEEFSNTLLKNIPFGMSIVDMEGNILFINENLQKNIEKELVGQKCQFYKDDNLRCANCPILTDIEIGESSVNEIEGVFGGKTFEIRHTGMMFQGKKAILEIFQDITHKKQSEIELIEAKEHAEESDRLKSAFLANMSHEIRTPMNGILGFSELLKAPNLSGEEQELYISIIEKSGKRMLNIINDIISISKIESGLMEVRMEESNMNEQIEYIYKFFTPEAEEKGIQLFTNDSLDTLDATINTDREKVYAILTNLVKNALKFTVKGTIELGCHKKGEFLEFYVKDTGIGVPKDRQEAIFERFIQADITDKMARQGAGLGLSISKAYVEMLGGKLWAESIEGKGSVFYFTLPNKTPVRATKIVEENDLIPLVANTTKKLKFLIADDDKASQLIISIAIKEFANEIIVAKNGIEAVEACRSNPDIDIVMMDIQMPEMGGFEATKQIRKFNKEVYIIAQTAYALIGDKEKVMEAGCNDYISKPIKVKELKQLISIYSLIK